MREERAKDKTLGVNINRANFFVHILPSARA